MTVMVVSKPKLLVAGVFGATVKKSETFMTVKGLKVWFP
jgi:hypothetical protein